MKSSHLGLVQTNVSEYSLDKSGKRINKVEGCSFIRCTIRLHLPLFLNPETWVRHSYSKRDIFETLSAFLPVHLWQFALLLNIIPSSSAVSVSFSTNESLIIGSKAIVVKKIENELQNLDLGSVDQLDKEFEYHIPPIPRHSITSDHFNRVSKDALLCDKSDLLKPLHLENPIALCGCQWVGLKTERKGLAVMCSRIVPWSTYVQSGRPFDTMATRPFDIRINGSRFAGTEESCIVTRSHGER
jgi:hypothetical protein